MIIKNDAFYHGRGDMSQNLVAAIAACCHDRRRPHAFRHARDHLRDSDGSERFERRVLGGVEHRDTVVAEHTGEPLAASDGNCVHRFARSEAARECDGLQRQLVDPAGNALDDDENAHTRPI